ncbi:MAG: ABC transporter ATP-binding protein [Candidatus Hermodarchaeota archaeon]
MIEVTNLTKKYNGLTVLQDISFHVDEGEILAYLGPNGAGKTTTVNILATLLTPTSGKATIAEYDVIKDGIKIRRLIGYVSEDFGLYPTLTTYENLYFAGGLYRISKKDRKEKIEELFEFFDLWEKKNVTVSTLSKGTKQKVNLARAMMHNPEILFLDEPTITLDPIMAKEVLNMILRLKKEGKTILMTTHLLTRAEKVCDSVALINEGKILCTGKISKIKTKLKSPTLEDVYLAVIGENHG